MNAKFWAQLRFTRNKFLVETDKTQLPDFPIDAKERTQYREYRQYLRNLPKLYNETNIEKFKVKSFQEWLDWRRGGEY